METSFISLGPTCVPAEILKASNLRTCSFGFDWSRSGSFHLREFLQLPLNDFLVRHVFQPNIPLFQPEDPMRQVSLTSEPLHIRPIYGYTYFLNPHRYIHSDDTKSYHLRCFRRMRTVIFAKNVKKVFVLADYQNKSHASFLHDPLLILRYLNNLFIQHNIENYILNLIRIRLIDDSPSTFDFSSNTISSHLHSHLVTFSQIYDDPAVRTHAYRLIAKRILHPHNSHLALWTGP